MRNPLHGSKKVEVKKFSKSLEWVGWVKGGKILKYPQNSEKRVFSEKKSEWHTFWVIPTPIQGLTKK